MKILDFLYFRLYLLALKTGLSQIPETVAFVHLTILLSFNLVVIFGYLGINILHYASARFISYSIGSIIMLCFYFYFVKNKRYISLIEQYKNETERQKKGGFAILYIYIIFSILALIFLKPKF